MQAHVDEDAKGSIHLLLFAECPGFPGFRVCFVDVYRWFPCSGSAGSAITFMCTQRNQEQEELDGNSR